MRGDMVSFKEREVLVDTAAYLDRGKRYAFMSAGCVIDNKSARRHDRGPDVTGEEPIMGLAEEILGLVIFLGAHVFVTMRDRRAALVARIGEWPYRGLFSVVVDRRRSSSSPTALPTIAPPA